MDSPDSVTSGVQFDIRNLAGYSPWGRKESDMTSDFTSKCKEERL